MDEPALVIEPPGSHHDRAAFSCGEPTLGAYLQQQASQDIRRRMAQVFVALGDAPGKIAGYYSLSAASFEKDELPPTLAKRLPHYPVPAAILGRLAVDREQQGRGLGETLLLDAVRRVVRASATLAVYAIVVDAKKDRALAFYERYGFRALPANSAASSCRWKPSRNSGCNWTRQVSHSRVEDDRRSSPQDDRHAAEPALRGEV